MSKIINQKMANDPQENLAIVHREGPEAHEYLTEFLIFLKNRTGYRPNHFRTPQELQQTFDCMQIIRLPITIWNAILNGSMRIFATCSDSINSGIEMFIKIFITVVNVVVTYCIDYFFLRAALRILCMLSSPGLNALITALYYFLNWVAQKIWQKALPRFESYCRLLGGEISNVFYGNEPNDNAKKN